MQLYHVRFDAFICLCLKRFFSLNVINVYASAGRDWPVEAWHKVLNTSVRSYYLVVCYQPCEHDILKTNQF